MSPEPDPNVDAIYPLVYEELRRIATAMRPSHSVTPTTLVHEAYLRLAKLHPGGAWDPLRVRVVASRAMRSVLVDRARRRQADKRGGDRQRVTLSGVAAEESDVDLLALDDALTALKAEDPTAYQIVELRFFGGLSNAEVGAALDMSLRTVERRWRAARALLRHLLGED